MKSRKPSPSFISRASLFVGGLSMVTIGFLIIGILLKFPINQFILTMTLALLLSTPPLAIILGIIGLYWNKVHHKSENKFAIAGILIGLIIGIGIPFTIFILQYMLATTLPDYSPAILDLPPLNP